MEFAHGPAGDVMHGIAQAIGDVVEHALVLVEVALALGGEMVDAASLGLDAAHEPLILEELERGIDGAGRRRVPPVQRVLERLEDLVAVTRLFAEETEDDELHFARLEGLRAAPAPRVVGTGPPVAPHGGLEAGKELGEVPVVAGHGHILAKSYVWYIVRYIVRNGEGRGFEPAMPPAEGSPGCPGAGARAAIGGGTKEPPGAPRGAVPPRRSRGGNCRHLRTGTLTFG
ncbi:MAG: hypothetical protein HY275_04795 [Gemmatimonadetes bacterium]|nr:hypothetical protein [Gemmatimonadota bacterium]